MNRLREFRVPLLILVIGSIVSVFAFRWDWPIRQNIVAEQGPEWGKSAERKMHGFIREWGDWPPMMVAAAIAYIIARARRNNRWSRIILAAMLASTLAGIVANASRLTTGRTRPRESPKIEQGFYGPWHEGRLLVGVPAYNSFPSGHTATAFGFASVFVYASPAWGVIVLAGAIAVAWSSIAIGAHHPSDVTVSITIALIVGWFVWRFARRWGGPEPNAPARSSTPECNSRRDSNP